MMTIDLKKLFDIDAQWARDYKIQLTAIGFNVPVVMNGLDGFVTLCEMAKAGVGEQGTINAIVGNALSFEDMTYVRVTGQYEGIDTSRESMEINKSRAAMWPSDETMLLSDIGPKLIPMATGKGTEFSVYNADVIWSNNMMSRSLPAMGNMNFPKFAIMFSSMAAGAFISLEEYRTALFRRTPSDLTYMKALIMADGLWWKNVHGVTGWSKIGKMSKNLINANIR